MSKDRGLQIKQKADKVRDMLLQKNKDYGSSALEPLNIFNKGKSTDSLCARIDDKLARIKNVGVSDSCLLYTSPSPRDRQKSRMPSSA